MLSNNQGSAYLFPLPEPAPFMSAPPLFAFSIAWAFSLVWAFSLALNLSASSALALAPACLTHSSLAPGSASLLHSIKAALSLSDWAKAGDTVAAPPAYSANSAAATYASAFVMVYSSVTENAVAAGMRCAAAIVGRASAGFKPCRQRL